MKWDGDNVGGWCLVGGGGGGGRGYPRFACLTVVGDHRPRVPEGTGHCSHKNALSFCYILPKLTHQLYLLHPIDRNPRQVRPLAAPYNIAFAFALANPFFETALNVSHACMHLKHCPSPPSARSWIVSYPPAKPYLVYS